jgi:hypothetical protein
MRLLMHGDAQPRWCMLCATCDKNQGRLRLMEHGWPHEDTITWERDPTHVPAKILDLGERERVIRNMHSKNVPTFINALTHSL